MYKHSVFIFINILNYIFVCCQPLKCGKWARDNRRKRIHPFNLTSIWIVWQIPVASRKGTPWNLWITVRSKSYETDRGRCRSQGAGAQWWIHDSSITLIEISFWVTDFEESAYLCSHFNNILLYELNIAPERCRMHEGCLKLRMKVDPG